MWGFQTSTWGSSLPSWEIMEEQGEDSPGMWVLSLLILGVGGHPLCEAPGPSLIPEKPGGLWRMLYGELRHCWVFGHPCSPGRDRDLEGALVQGPTFSQALA